MDARALLYGIPIGFMTLLAVWIANATWQEERRLRRRVQMRLRQLQRTDLGFARSGR